MHGVVGIDIIVANDVPPEAVLKIRNAKCVISGEGGLLNHGEILSMEFGIPFIAGVSNIISELAYDDEIEIYPFEGFIEIRDARSEKIFNILENSPDLVGG